MNNSETFEEYFLKVMRDEFPDLVKNVSKEYKQRDVDEQDLKIFHSLVLHWEKYKNSVSNNEIKNGK